MSYKKWVFIAIFLFGGGLVFGLAIGMAAPPSIASLFSEDIDFLKELSGFLVPFSALTVIFIFLKNASALLISFVLSPILCLVPVLTLTVNGGMIALVSTTVMQEGSLSYLLAGLLPHGIFEIPALIMGNAAALSFGIMVMLVPFKKGGGKLLMPGLKQNLRYLIVALALLLPAAIIETYVTPLLLT